MNVSKKLILSLLIASSFVMTACGGENDKVYPKGSGPNAQDDDVDPSEKPEPGSGKFATAQLSTTLAAALLEIDRTLDIAFHKENASSLVRAGDCQVLAPNTGNLAVVVDTDGFKCRRTSSGTDWNGNERIEMTAGSDDFYQTIKTELRTNSAEVSLRSRDHEIRTQIQLTKSSNSRPGNRVTYNFTAYLELKSETTLTAHTLPSRPSNQDNERNERNDRRESSTPTELKATMIVTLEGRVEVDKSTKRLASVLLNEATVEGSRESLKGRLNIETKTKLTIRPSAQSPDFAETAACGRIESEFGVTQTLDRIANGRASDTIERNSRLRMTPSSITSVGSQTVRLAQCRPGFATLAADLDAYATGVFGPFGK